MKKLFILTIALLSAVMLVAQTAKEDALQSLDGTVAGI